MNKIIYRNSGETGEAVDKYAESKPESKPRGLNIRRKKNAGNKECELDG